MNDPNTSYNINEYLSDADIDDNESKDYHNKYREIPIEEIRKEDLPDTSILSTTRITRNKKKKNSNLPKIIINDEIDEEEEIAYFNNLQENANRLSSVNIEYLDCIEKTNNEISKENKYGLQINKEDYIFSNSIDVDNHGDSKLKSYCTMKKDSEINKSININLDNSNNEYMVNNDFDDHDYNKISNYSKKHNNVQYNTYQEDLSLNKNDNACENKCNSKIVADCSLHINNNININIDMSHNQNNFENYNTKNRPTKRFNNIYTHALTSIISCIFNKFQIALKEQAFLIIKIYAYYNSKVINNKKNNIICISNDTNNINNKKTRIKVKHNKNQKNKLIKLTSSPFKDNSKDYMMKESNLDYKSDGNNEVINNNNSHLKKQYNNSILIRQLQVAMTIPSESIFDINDFIQSTSNIKNYFKSNIEESLNLNDSFNQEMMSYLNDVANERTFDNNDYDYNNENIYMEDKIHIDKLRKEISEYIELGDKRKSKIEINEEHINRMEIDKMNLLLMMYSLKLSNDGFIS